MFLVLKCIAWKCLWDQREFPGWEDLTPQYTSCCQVSSTGSAGLHSSTVSIMFRMIKCLQNLRDGQRSEAHSKPLQPRQSITLAFLISCHWPPCTSWCSEGTGSVHPVAHLLKSACCFANWEFPVYKDEQALLERFLLFDYSKKMESINHQQSNPRRIPVNPDCELQ